MDVRLYPPPPQPLPGQDPSRLGQMHYPDSTYENKLDSDTMFLGMQEVGLDFGSTNQVSSLLTRSFSQAGHPTSKQSPWSRETHPDAHRMPWSYPTLGDEDYNIPPITPPNLHPHLSHAQAGPYHPLAPPASHPYHLQGMELSAMMGQDGGRLSRDGGPMSSTLSVMQQMVNSDSRFTNSQQPMEALRPRSQPGMVQQGQLTTINQSQLGLGGNTVSHNSPSPPGSKSATPSPSSSVHEDENEEALRQGGGAEKRPVLDVPKKPKTPKKKKKRDPNEPQKPVSAYALFFRDTQANIKIQNPNATFGEVSKIVASMWDGLGEEQKQMYKKKTETAKKEYLKQLAAYRASLVSQSYNDPSEMKMSSSSSVLSPKPSVYPGHPAQHPHPGMYLSHPYHHPSHPQPQSHSPSLSPHLQGLSSREAAPRATGAHQGALSMGSMAAHSPPALQISPPLHSHAHLGTHTHQLNGHSHQMNGHTLSMHSHAMNQGYAVQTDFPGMLAMPGLGPGPGGPSGPAGMEMRASMDYQHLGRPGPSQSLDWSSQYHHNNGSPQREKSLFLS
ncbi:thymocyte selection-associated high mobility group box protein TOX [Aplochiton taeniatus]